MPSPNRYLTLPVLLSVGRSIGCTLTPPCDTVRQAPVPGTRPHPLGGRALLGVLVTVGFPAPAQYLALRESSKIRSDSLAEGVLSRIGFRECGSQQQACTKSLPCSSFHWDACGDTRAPPPSVPAHCGPQRPKGTCSGRPVLTISSFFLCWIKGGPRPVTFLT